MRRPHKSRKSRRSSVSPKKAREAVRKRRRKPIGDARLERAVRVYSETRDIKAAARAIRVSQEQLTRTLKRKFPTRKHATLWVGVRRLPRKMPIFAEGRQLAITVPSRSASLIARYMNAVGQFLRTNDPKVLREYEGRSVKDALGKARPFETDPNTLYRLSSAGGEPFEEIYRIVI